mmetsp:Transcript_27056/g.19500  ORF Transcript_27056/g.19500 Transcript_27056/m.19500 type:complete len:204 (+) Transcript_27056:2690-3301(+)
MRAKKLEILKFKGNTGIGAGADSIIYNLAFSPKIRHIDMSDIASTTSQTAEALYKLLKISGAIETLILSNSGVFAFFTEDFYVALGENKTINYINLDHKSALPVAQVRLLGKAIAMNAKRNGSLLGLSIKYWLSTYSNLAAFLGAMEVSDYDHELWYGDKKIAKEMTKEKLDKVFYSNLKYLNLEESKIGNNHFKLKEYQKKT